MLVQKIESLPPAYMVYVDFAGRYELRKNKEKIMTFLDVKSLEMVVDNILGENNDSARN